MHVKRAAKDVLARSGPRVFSGLVVIFATMKPYSITFYGILLILYSYTITSYIENTFYSHFINSCC